MAPATVRVELTKGGATAVLEARVCYPPRALDDGSGAARAGVRFRRVTETREGRAAVNQLDRIVNELQREMVRRKRMDAA